MVSLLNHGVPIYYSEQSTGATEMRMERTALAFATTTEIISVARKRYFAAWQALMILKNRYDGLFDVGPAPSAAIHLVATRLAQEELGLGLVEDASAWLADYHTRATVTMQAGGEGIFSADRESAPGDARAGVFKANGAGAD